MTKKKNVNEVCNHEGLACDCNQGSECRVEAILSVDERGQMVLPKDVRDKAGINSGNKLALISWGKEGSICCLALIKAENLSGMIKEVLDPLMHMNDKKE
ncbi:HgcAB-associated protein HgcC [Methanolobus chelungpuianus]|uniref:AbrB family transcriptional regulator n=1 Tax=Methanolobus chelungpuianus TaxID=502115 RepID=A0AAE3HC51_9EURY|nr:HgcAB-associated protein [Methanolobus chelungpuianus]MCQ6963646.1 AbrB family transcriptional regulator [Methanolobus chelungpuianus]